MKRCVLLVLISGFFVADVAEAGLLRNIFRSQRQKRNCYRQSTNDQKASPKSEQKISPETKNAKKLMDLTASEYWRMIDRESIIVQKAVIPDTTKKLVDLTTFEYWQMIDRENTKIRPATIQNESSPPAPPETVTRTSPVPDSGLLKPQAAFKILTAPNATKAKGKPFVKPPVTPIVEKPTEKQQIPILDKPVFNKPFTIIPK